MCIEELLDDVEMPEAECRQDPDHVDWHASAVLKVSMAAVFLKRHSVVPTYSVTCLGNGLHY